MLLLLSKKMKVKNEISGRIDIKISTNLYGNLFIFILVLLKLKS